MYNGKDGKSIQTFTTGDRPVAELVQREWRFAAQVVAASSSGDGERFWYGRGNRSVVMVFSSQLTMVLRYGLPRALHNRLFVIPYSARMVSFVQTPFQSKKYHPVDGLLRPTAPRSQRLPELKAVKSSLSCLMSL
jgi:hypothetical protein